MKNVAAPRGPLIDARLLRIVTGVFGAYVATWGLTALITVLSVWWLDLPYEDASNLAMMIGFLAYAALFLWAFLVRRAWVASAVLFGGGAMLIGLASLLQRVVVS